MTTCPSFFEMIHISKSLRGENIKQFILFNTENIIFLMLRSYITTNVTPSFIFHRSIFSDFFFNTKFRIHSHINTAQHRCVLNAFSGHLG